MKRNDFLQKLQERVREQQRLYKDIPFPYFFFFVAKHLGNHPWKPLIPLSVLVSIVLYSTFGQRYIDFILWIFKAM